MNGSGEFQIKLSENFEREQQKLIRVHYRKNPAAAAKFIELIQQFIIILSINPRPRPPLGHLEPWPKGTNCAGWELWKLEFKMPTLRGAAGQGRLIYLINTVQKQVVLVWIYTHAEFEKRPPDQNLKRLLGEIIESDNVSDESNSSTQLQEGEIAEQEVGDEESSDGCSSDS
ncbi:hypothetical protein [Microseira wollei]|uniref:Uncharacterized protein n=1 Tax=Microseira wollei NIES-4236 TaxID=2530354 RepID=A0AAV3XG69_9CYAN|nr:hypothetical protein [Microseira wollei]GET41253.1 hypothetical protein MiSe_60650 [Microseira wollei NIES-4236]